MYYNKTECMNYMDYMDVIDSNCMDKVLALVEKYDYEKFNKANVEKALSKDNLTVEDYAAILSPSAIPYLEEMARKAKIITRQRFGNSITMFTPLYISNYCENNCIYCGFNCKNKIRRGKLSLEDIDKEMKNISSTGLSEILILTGESKAKSDVNYIGDAIKIATKYFSTIGIEIYSLNIDEYNYLKKCGADFVSVYQETYNINRYEQVHLSGPKRIFPYRFYSQERALLGGFRGVSFGALLGLDDFRKDAYATGLHAFFLQQKFPHAEIGFSVPRIRPYINNINNKTDGISERQLLHIMLAYRLFMPYAGITISTRERAEFRDNVIGLVATKISAGVKVGIGGHSDEQKGDEQFQISDYRNVEEIHKLILKRGLQPVYKDYINV